MDPTKTLEEIRKTVEDINSGNEKSSHQEDLEKLMGHIYALDHWLTSGGFIPDQWLPTVYAAPGFTDAQERTIRRLYTLTQQPHDYAAFRSKFSNHAHMGCAGGMWNGVFYGIEPDGNTHT